MREYEFNYILQPDITDEREQEIHGVVDSEVAGANGTILVRDDWGKRKLAYEIAKFQKGHYFVTSFVTPDGSAIPELERRMRLDPDVLRFLTVQVSEKVADLESRVQWGKEQEAEQERRREERERERAEREAASAMDDDGVGIGVGAGRGDRRDDE